MRQGLARPTGMHGSLADRLARQVLQLIKDQQLDPGERMPSVRDLAERFSVATPTMREALTLLQMAGNLDIRHGSGVYVRDAEPRLLLTNPYGAELDGETILQLLATRRIVEPAAAALAAHAAEPEQLGRLAALLQSAEAYLAGDASADASLMVFNMSFHRGIADASGNRVLAEVVHTLTEVRVKEQMAVLDLYNDRERDHAQHRDVLAALQARDAERARALMLEHLDEVQSVVLQRLGQP